MTSFQEPLDSPDAQWRVDVLQEEIARIESQLADPRRKTDRASGRPLAEADYQAWTAKAQDALYHKRRELGYLNAWLERRAPKLELLTALEEAMPLLSGLGAGPIKKLLEVFGMITGAFKRE